MKRIEKQRKHAAEATEGLQKAREFNSYDCPLNGLFMHSF